MRKAPERASSVLYRRLKLLRIGLTIAGLLVALGAEVGEVGAHSLLSDFVSVQGIPTDFVVYCLAGPVLIWLTLTWFGRRVRERDEAEARLHVSYQLSQEVANAPDVGALLQLALELPERLLGGVAAGLVMQNAPDSSWDLIGAHGLTENQRASLEAFAISAGESFHCGRCSVRQASIHWDCPMLGTLQNPLEPAPAAAICLPLSKSHGRHILLNVYLTNAQAPSAEALHTLESLAAALAVAIDRAGLRSRETQMLQQVEQAVRARTTSQATLRQLLADIGATYDADFGAILLAPAESGTTTSATIACWPGEEPDPSLAQAAEQAMRMANSEVTLLSAETGQIMTIPLVAERQYVGVMVLSGRFSPGSAQLASLQVVASTMAMMVRNGQLSAALESHAALEERYRLAREVHDSFGQYLGFLNFKVQQAERSLNRYELAAASMALHEARASIDDLNAELRLTIQDLRLPPKESPGLVRRMGDIVASYARSSRLAVSFAAEGDLALGSEVEVQLLRILREALTNVQRHAQAQQAWVRVAAGPEIVTLEVQDDGVGFSESEPSQALEHFGLRMMQERVAAIGGHFELHSAPGQGVRLQVSVPLPRVDALA